MSDSHSHESSDPRNPDPRKGEQARPQSPLQGTPAGPTEISDLPDGMRQVVLVKDGQRFVFRYEQGEESKVLASLMQMAKDPDNQLDWFDAAVLSHQMGRRMSKRLEQLLKP